MLLPYKRHSYHLPYSADEAETRLKNEADLLWGRGKHMYEGHVYNRQFRMERKITNRNLAWPVIEGQIQQARQGSVIHATFRMDYTTMVFWGIALGMLLVISVGVFIGGILDGRLNWMCLFPFGIGLLFYTLITGWNRFWTGADVEEFERIFNADLPAVSVPENLNAGAVTKRFDTSTIRNS